MRRLTMVLISLASLSLLTLLLVVRLGSWTPRWWLDSLDTFALYAFFPFVGTLALALVLRSRVLAVISIGATALYAHQFGAQTLGTLNLSGPTAAEAAPEVVQLRVLTLNVHASYEDPKPLVDLLTRWRPDVVILQEVSGQFAEVAMSAIGEDYPFSFAVGLETEHEGSATWSRLPLREADEIFASTTC